jgi:predicted phage gp36 major capsid-like protein
MIEDSGVDILGFLADQSRPRNWLQRQQRSDRWYRHDAAERYRYRFDARHHGRHGRISGAFTADNLIDLAYSVDGAARMLPGAGFMMNGQSIGAVRKLKDTAGQLRIRPSLAVGVPDTLLGFPLHRESGDG